MNHFKYSAVRLAFVPGVVAALAAMAAAGQVTYTNLPTVDASKADLTNSNAAQSQFLSSLSSYGTDDLESLSGVVNPTLTFGATGITAPTTFAEAETYFPLAVSGVVALLDQGPSTPDGPAFNDMMTFSSPVTAFGSYFVQGGDGPANTLTLRLENTLLGTSKDVVVGTLGPNAPFYNVFYFGVTDTDPFNRVTMIESYDYDGILLDNITVGTVAVPEPGAFVLLACGAALPLLIRVGRRANRLRLR